MGDVPGWAFTTDESAESTRRRVRYDEIKHLRDDVIQGRNPMHGMTRYTGCAPESLDLTDLDIALLCDDGNTCFGATVNWSGRCFRCTIFTD